MQRLLLFLNFRLHLTDYKRVQPLLGSAARKVAWIHNLRQSR